MKTNIIFAAALAATTLFASCAKEEPSGGAVTNGEKTFAGISVSIPMSPADTRAGSEQNIASTAESAITKVGVFVVGATTVDKLYLETAGTDFEFNTATGIATAKKAILTSTGPKKIYVVTNYTSALKTQIDQMGVAAFDQNAIALTEADFKAETSGAITSMTMTGVKEVTLTVKTEAEALASLETVEVYRNLAKVVVRYGAAITPTGGTHEANSVQFGLASKAKGAWLWNTPNDGATATAYTGVTAAALLSETDAYWSNFSAPAVGATAADWKAVSAFSSTPDYKTMPAWYAHENVYKADGSNLELYVGNTTVARIRGKFIPATWVTAYNATTGARTSAANTATAAASFYRLNDGSYWSTAAYTTATTAATTYKIDAANFSAIYQDGMGYYTIKVMDDTRVPGVKRNNYYDLAINSIDGPGSPTENPDESDVTDPLDEESYVSVSVNVKAWWQQKSEHDLQ
jgi:hypothetical protein